MNYLEFRKIALGDKGSSGNHIYLIYRNISVPISFVIFKYTNILPNQISVSMIILLVLGALLTLYSHIYLKQIGYLLIFLSFIFDKIDGELARTRKIYSELGIVLDHIYHILFWILFPLSLAITAFLNTHEKNAFYFAFMIIIINLIIRFGKKAKINNNNRKQITKMFINYFIYHQINFFIYGAIIYWFYPKGLNVFLVIYSILFILKFSLRKLIRKF